MNGLVGSNCVINMDDKPIFRGVIMDIRFCQTQENWHFLILTEKGKLVCYSTNEMYRTLTVVKESTSAAPFR